MNSFRVTYKSGRYYNTSANGTAEQLKAHLCLDGCRITFEDSSGKEFHEYVDTVEQIVYHVFADGIDEFYGDIREAEAAYDRLAKEHENVRLYWEIEEDGATIAEDFIKGKGDTPS